MTKEKLYELIGNIDDKHIEDAQKIKIRQKYSWMKWATIAACLCVFLLGKKAYSTFCPTNFEDLFSQKQFGTFENEEVLQTINIHFEGKIAEYKKLNTIISSKIAPFAGREFYPSKVTNFLGGSCPQSEDTKWYYPVGIDNLKYLISYTNGRYTLWEFLRFEIPDEETYTYEDILTIIYNVHSANDIVSITTMPSKHNQTDLGIIAQKEVGTHTFTEREDISAFYNMIIDTVYVGMIYPEGGDVNDVRIYEASVWQNRFTYSFSTDDEETRNSLDSVYGRRVLSIELTDGTTIDSWRYNALAGLFYESGGIYSELLDDNKVATLNKIFGIE